MSLINLFPDNEEGWGFYNTPANREVNPDLLLIGIIHTEFGGRKFDNKMFEFKRRLHSLDHLAFEGEEHVHEQNKSLHVDNYEQVGYKHFKGQKHYLDESANYSKILEKYGVSRELFTLLIALRDLKSAASHTGGETLEKIEFGFEFKKRTYFGSEEVDTKKVMQNVTAFLVEVLIKIDENLPACLVAQEAFFQYLPRIRDYEVYAPRLKKMQTDFQGKKGAILGANHIDYLYGILSAKIKTPPPQWKELFQEMDDESKKGVMFLEDFISKQRI